MEGSSSSHNPRSAQFVQKVTQARNVLAAVNYVGFTQPLVCRTTSTLKKCLNFHWGTGHECLILVLQLRNPYVCCSKSLDMNKLRDMTCDQHWDNEEELRKHHKKTK